MAHFVVVLHKKLPAHAGSFLYCLGSVYFYTSYFTIEVFR
jgi:hypothetical protein